MPAETTFQVDPEHQFHRLPAVLARYGISPSTAYRWMAEGRFPKAEQLGPNVKAHRESTLREYDADPMGWIEKHSSKQGGEL